ncbi:Peptidase-M28 domain-containing protein [Aphelenchoides bicaudatus]|nr:Peptidase-M28 domain-containing protein [Aphelenchoides bicaudatus]
MSGETRQRRINKIIKEVETEFKYVQVDEFRGSNELRFRHWLFIIIGLALIYASVVYLDRPKKEPANFLEQLTALGPRSSGSVALEVDAVQMVTKRINDIQEKFAKGGVNRLELDIQRPTGCYNLAFLTPFTLCYHEVTNIVVRIGANNPSRHAILLNCHLDTLPDTPGATDDAVSCAIYLETLEILAQRKTPLENDIIFLFNGAEENFLQASHGFITQHRWRHDIRAFINLEGTGSGGREILFQSGPNDAWTLEAYLDHAPYPHCSAIAQEIFQLGIAWTLRITETDGSLFDHCEFQVYHTEFDSADVISSGSIQRAGENILAVAEAMIRSPYLTKPSKFDESNKWVFYDVVGLFTVRYKLVYGTIVNYAVILGVAALVFIHFFRNRAYHEMSLLDAFGHHLAAFGVMALTGIFVACMVHLFNLTMCWYSLPELVFPLYIIPMLISGCWTHSRFALKMRGRRAKPNFSYKPLYAELVHYDAVLIYWSVILFIMTASGLASAFFILFHVFFPALRDPIISAYLRFTKKPLTPWIVFVVQWICLLPLWDDLATSYLRKFLLMVLSLITASTFVLFTSNLIYLSRPMSYFFKAAVAFFIFCFLIIGTTRVGNPYKWSDDGLPRLRRIIALHAKRSIYDFQGNLNKSSNGLFIQSFDYRGVDDLPEHTFLQGSDKPDCSNTNDAYCQLPYYTAIYDLLPPEKSRWIDLPTAPTLPYPLSVELLDRSFTENNNKLNMSFVIRGGVDKMSLHISPLNGYQLKEFSFTKFEQNILGTRQTYFVFMTYGHRAPEDRRFWVVLERNSAATNQDPTKSPNLELAIATHQAHGRYQNSPTLHQLRSLINTRRKTPHLAVGFWRWGITMISGTSELISHLF